MSSLLRELEAFAVTFWPVFVPLALGLAAVYLLLPRARRYPPLWGGAAAGLALAATGWLLVRADLAPVERILFYGFGGLAVVSAGMMLTMRNPVHAALSFALVVLSSCGVFLLNGAPFLMAATIIVYAGAIVVTFLFVIMLAQQEGPSSADQRSREPFLATVAGFLLLGALLCVLHRTYDTAPIDGLLARVAAARAADSVEAAKAALGDYDGFKKEVRRLVTGPEDRPLPRTGPRAELSARQSELDELLHELDTPFEAVRKKLDEVYRAGAELRARHGALTPSDRLPLSSFSGARASDPVPVDEQGRVKPRLPAANVAAVGRSLFGDYLLAVAVTAVLLLVATIGAIAIAARSPARPRVGAASSPEEALR